MEGYEPRFPTNAMMMSLNLLDIFQVPAFQFDIWRGFENKVGYARVLCDDGKFFNYVFIVDPKELKVRKCGHLAVN